MRWRQALLTSIISLKYLEFGIKMIGNSWSFIPYMIQLDGPWVSKGAKVRSYMPSSFPVPHLLTEEYSPHCKKRARKKCEKQAKKAAERFSFEYRVSIYWTKRKKSYIPLERKSWNRYFHCFESLKGHFEKSNYTIR
jgi:hypothetical protein